MKIVDSGFSLDSCDNGCGVMFINTSHTERRVLADLRSRDEQEAHCYQHASYCSLTVWTYLDEMDRAHKGTYVSPSLTPSK